MELHVFPLFADFAERNGYTLELATYQNWYPDLTFISKENPEIKFAVDLKTTYRNSEYPEFCNGFTLGSHGEYFVNRESNKNIQYPYSSYAGHFCLGIIYTRAAADKNSETKVYSVDDVEKIPSVIKDFIFFAEENGVSQATRAEAETPRISGVSAAFRIFSTETEYLQRRAKSCSTTTGRISAKFKFPRGAASLKSCRRSRNF